MMYLGQILLPLPSHMPFNYDQLTISRTLIEPLTTLPALLAVIALLAWAGLWRTRRPVFACGVLLFFAGHLLTSTIIPVEMAFEHRNHLPLIGVLLALADLVAAGWQRLHARRDLPIVFTTVIVALVAVAGGCVPTPGGSPSGLHATWSTFRRILRAPGWPWAVFTSISPVGRPGRQSLHGSGHRDRRRGRGPDGSRRRTPTS